MYAGFRPDDDRLDPLWEYAAQHRPARCCCTPARRSSRQAPLECTLPRHLDRVAMRYPEVRIILAHLGHPYEGECVAVIRKHPNVYADISALHYRPFQLYHSLMLVQEYGVWHKVLFGTDYPFTTVQRDDRRLAVAQRMVEGTALPRLDDRRDRRADPPRQPADLGLSELSEACAMAALRASRGTSGNEPRAKKMCSARPPAGRAAHGAAGFQQRVVTGQSEHGAQRPAREKLAAKLAAVVCGQVRGIAGRQKCDARPWPPIPKVAGKGRARRPSAAKRRRPHRQSADRAALASCGNTPPTGIRPPRRSTSRSPRQVNDRPRAARN